MEASSSRARPAGSIVPLLLLLCGAAMSQASAALGDGFVTVEGVQLRVDGKPFYVNGWNSYWLMAKAAERLYGIQSSGNIETLVALDDIFNRDGGVVEEVREVLVAGSALGMTVCRAWAFSNGGYNALQIKPGVYDSILFKALDIVVAEAKKHNVKLILGLANDLPAYGGKEQYVKWALQAGHELSIPSNDSFYLDAVIKDYYKQYVKAVLTRKNTVTGIAYRDDPTILAWDLINEPRCASDPSGHRLKAWIEEMAAYVKELDKNHLVTIGMEGFYRGNTPGRQTANPYMDWADNLGTDFIEQNKIRDIDFASVHAYPDSWVPWCSSEEKLQFLNAWLDVHIQDAQQLLGKPVLFTEFGINNQADPILDEPTKAVLESIFSKMYESAKSGGAGAGSLLWQFKAHDMHNLVDNFSIAPSAKPPVAQLLAAHSCRLQALSGTFRERACSDLETDTAA